MKGRVKRFPSSAKHQSGKGKTKAPASSRNLGLKGIGGLVLLGMAGLLISFLFVIGRVCHRNPRRLDAFNADGRTLTICVIALALLIRRGDRLFEFVLI